MRSKFIDGIALTIAIVGALNWGLIGFFNFDLVAFLFGSMTWLSRIVYALVGISGLYLLTFYLYLSDETSQAQHLTPYNPRKMIYPELLQKICFTKYDKFKTHSCHYLVNFYRQFRIKKGTAAKCNSPFKAIVHLRTIFISLIIFYLHKMFYLRNVHPDQNVLQLL